MDTEQNIFIKWDKPHFKIEIKNVFNLDNHHIVRIVKYPTKHPRRSISFIKEPIPSKLLWCGEILECPSNISIKHLVELVVSKYLEIGWNYSLKYDISPSDLTKIPGNLKIESYLIDFKKTL